MEGYGAASYGEGFADVYDEWYGDVTDAAATAEALAGLARAGGTGGGGPVLELGIGSGRIALALAGAGLEVWGIDASPAMIERLRAKPGGDRIPVAVGDMAELDLGRLPGGTAARFSVVAVTFNTFFNLASAAAQQRCLERVAAVLAPGGRFVVEAVVPDDQGPAGAVEVRTVAIDRVVLTVSKRGEGGVVDGQTVELSEAGGVRLRPWVVRPVGPEELEAMAGAAGLVLDQRWSGWDRRPYRPGDAVHVSVFRREGG